MAAFFGEYVEMMKQMTLYLKAADVTLVLTAISDNTPSLLNDNGNIDRGVLQKKREEIFNQGKLLPTGQAVIIPSLMNLKGRIYGTK